MPWIWRRCMARRASASVVRREPAASPSAAIGFRKDGAEVPMNLAAVGNSAKIYVGKPLGLVSLDPARLRQNPGIPVVFQRKLSATACRGTRDGETGRTALAATAFGGKGLVWLHRAPGESVRVL